nr:hypothetical protein [Tanacetum cinerariifolium]
MDDPNITMEEYIRLVEKKSSQALATTLNRLERSIHWDPQVVSEPVKNFGFQSLSSQLETHGAGVSTKDANQKFLRSLPSFWSQVSLIMRTKPGVDTLSFDDLYNNLRIFVSDVKGSTGSSSSTKNVAFVSSDNTCSTNEVNTAYGVSTSSGHNSQKEGSSSYTDDLTYSFFAINLVVHNWIMKILNRSKGNPDSRRRDAGNIGYKARDNGKRPTKQDEHKDMFTIDGEGVDWTGHAEDDTEDYALIAFNSNNSGSHTEVTSCSKVCKESYAKLKKLYDEQREQLGDASIEIQAYTLALKKVEAQLVCHQKNQLAYEEKIRFMKIDLDDKTNLLICHKKLLAEAEREKEELKTKFENFQSSSKGLSKLLNSQMSAKDKSGLGSSDVEDSPVNDRFAKVEGMHAVPPPMTGNYMPPKSNFGIDDSSEEILETVPKPVQSKPKVVNEHKVWSNAPIIEEYESDSDDEYVSKASVEKKPSCAFINTVKHEETPRQTIQDQDTFKNRDIFEFCGSKGVKREYSNVELRNKMELLKVSTACYVLNRVLVTKPQNKTPFELLTGKFEEKFDEGFLVEYSLSSKAFRLYNLETKRVEKKMHINFLENKPNVPGKGPNWLFDLDYLIDSLNYLPITTENKAKKIVGPKETNNSAAKNGDETLNEDTDSKTNEEPVDQEDQAFLEELERLKRQEKEANDAAKTLRKTFAQSTKDLLLQARAARASSTNYVNTASTPVNAASTSLNAASTPTNQDDSQIPSLEDIHKVSRDGIFTSASYDNDGAMDDFTNLGSTVNVSPILQSRIHSIHPITQILGDPNSVVLTRSKCDTRQFSDFK